MLMSTSYEIAKVRWSDAGMCVHSSETRLNCQEKYLQNGNVTRESQHTPSNHIAFVRIEFADGSIYEISPDMRRNSIANRRSKKGRRKARRIASLG